MDVSTSMSVGSGVVEVGGVSGGEAVSLESVESVVLSSSGSLSG